MASENVLRSITPEARRIAAERFDRASQVVASGNYDYAIQLLLTCCKLDPSNFLFRQTLRRTQKAKYNNNLRGSRLAMVTTFRTRAKLKTAKRNRDYLKVLELGEQILARNPWDIGAQMDMAEAADAVGLIEHAIFILDQARQKDQDNATINRALARLFEKRGNFAHAIALWQRVKDVAPDDVEAAHKAKDLAASETIQRGGYQEASAEGESLAGGSRFGDRTPLASKTGSSEKPALGHTPIAEQNSRVNREAAPILARLESNPTDPHLYLQLATVYSRGNLPDRARAALEQGLGPTGNDFRLQIELMEMDLDPLRKNLSIAEKKLAKATEDEENSRYSPDDLRKYRAKILKEINAREIELFRIKADRYPQDLNYRLDLGTKLKNSELYDEAIVELQQARKDPKLAWKAALQLGLCFKSRNNWRLAQRNLEEALAQIPSNEEELRKELLFNLATGSAEAGELQRAIDLGHDLANIDYGYRDIAKLIEQWNERLQEV